MGNKHANLNNFVNMCQCLAQKSEMTHRHGCVIVYANKIVAHGWNQFSESLVDSMSVHAEISAINQVRKKRIPLDMCDMYVVRIGGGRCSDNLKCSKPCDRCSAVINRHRLRRVYYSA